jgi:hypothetical protein
MESHHRGKHHPDNVWANDMRNPTGDSFIIIFDEIEAVLY